MFEVSGNWGSFFNLQTKYSTPLQKEEITYIKFKRLKQTKGPAMVYQFAVSAAEASSSHLNRTESFQLNKVS